MTEILNSFLTPEAMTALLQVIMIDLVLAGDNAVVIGLAAAGLPKHQRAKAILIGIIAATVLRIGFAAATTQLLQIVGLLFVGGLLLLWVCWKMWSELQSGHGQETLALEGAAAGEGSHGTTTAAPNKTFAQAAWQIVIADVSMSLDNVLAVAGAARDDFTVLVVGLVFSVALMGLAASLIARLLHRYRWIAYVGLAIVLYVALHMIWDGGRSVIVRTGHADQFNASVPGFLHISAEEQAKHMKHSGKGAGSHTPHALPGGRERRDPPPQRVPVEPTS